MLAIGEWIRGEDPSFCSGLLSSAIKHSSRFCVFLSRPQSKLCSLEVVQPFSYITKTLLEKFFSALTGRQVCEKKNVKREFEAFQVSKTFHGN